MSIAGQIGGDDDGDGRLLMALDQGRSWQLNA